MESKRPYKHILKNLFHEQATELIPLLKPGYWVKEILDIELPDLISTPMGGPPSDLEQGLVGLVLPGAEIVQAYQTEWIEHSGTFERAYRIHNPETDKPSYMLIEFQTSPGEEELHDLPRRFLSIFATTIRYVVESLEDEGMEDLNVVVEGKGTFNQGYDIAPIVLCPFPHAIPAHIRETFQGEVLLEFKFPKLFLWEKDAREFLNSHVSATYFLLPVMQNADAALLGIAIVELAQRFQNDETELGRHLTGMHLLLQQSEMMSEEEKLVAQGHLKPYMHLIKDDPDDE